MVRTGIVLSVVALSTACGSSESTEGKGDSSGGTAGNSGAAGSTSRGGSAGGGGVSTGGAATGGAGGSSGSGGVTGGAAGSGAMPGMCPGTTNHTPGTRLRPRFVVTEDGVRNWTGWHDSMLDVECDFNPTSDGVTRCLPVNWSGGTEYFVDAACTDPVYTESLTAPCTPSNYIMSFVSAGCGMPSGYELFERGGPVPASTALYAASGTGCEPVTVTSPVYRKGAAVPPSTFVSATYGNEAGMGRLGTSAYTAADGTLQVTGWIDSMLQTACTIVGAEDGELRCLPNGATMFQTFSDAGCTTRAFAYATGCGGGEPPPYARLSPRSDCLNDPYRILATGSVVAGPLYTGSPASCALVEPVPEGTIYATSPIPPSMFMAVGVRVDEGAPGRLKPRYHTTDDGGCWFLSFHDSELDLDCSLVRVGDRYRCLPGVGTGRTINAFRDASCTNPVLVMPVVTSCPEVPTEPPRHVLTYASAECGTTWTSAEVGTTTLPAAGLFQLAGTACVPVTGASEYLTLTPLPAEQFVAGDLRIE